MRSIYPYISILFLAFLGACAQFASPQGGPKDTDPPYIIKELSEDNLQTRFTKKEFRISFNEWIQLSNPSKEIVISPPISFPLQTQIKGKSVIIKFGEEEKLKEDVTYQINFGNAIKDFTEGNVYKNFIFVFSTGDEIDSLSVSGSVVDAMTNKAKADVLVCLYDNLSDSAIIQEKPFYFTRTDQSGRFKLNNLRSDSFKIYSLKDENVNYYFDLSSEEAGFYEQTIVLRDSNLINIDLKIFDEEDEPRIISYDQEKKGLIKLSLLPPTKELELSHLTKDSFYHFMEYQNDSLYIWHTDTRSDSSKFVLHYASRSDTLQNKKSKYHISDTQLQLAPSVKASVSVHRKDTIKISFNKPLSAVDSVLLQLKDSSLIYSVDYMKTSNRDLLIYCNELDHNSEYQLSILPENITDIYGTSNNDTIRLDIKTYDPEDLGTITLRYNNESDTSYIIQFLDKDNIIAEHVVDSSRIVKFEKLLKGTYRLKIIEDLNRDNKWTSGLVVKKRMPERVKELSLDELKPSWDLDLDIKIKEIFYGTPIE